ncbi:MAG: hypothetical protein JKY56_04255 [Kofleriaceae bacterium]|nr:hypothetical protein [Kofleriaceae bacterium]
MDERISQLSNWCIEQTSNDECDYELRLVSGVPLSDEELDAIPRYPLDFSFETPSEYRPEAFTVPKRYRQLLSMSGGFRIEYRAKSVDEGQKKWKVWPLVELFRPGTCEAAHYGDAPTLCDSWVTAETELDDREIDLTRFISFANAGISGVASRWCFLIGTDSKEPEIYLEDNDDECVIGHWADTGEWISDDTEPFFSSFSEWLDVLVDVVTRSTFDIKNNDEFIAEIFQHTQQE